MNYSRSEEYRQLAQSRIMHSVLTLSKSPDFIAPGACPVFIEKAKGAYFWDCDGNRFLDFPMALGPIILGYAFDEVDEAVKEQIGHGMLYSLSSPKEIELAELLQEVAPSAEKIKILKSGSEATSAAIRVARAYTGREKVAACGYHGWHDWTVVRTTRNAGIPNANRTSIFEFQYNDIESLADIFKNNPDEIGAVILEPVGICEPQGNFLQQVIDTAHTHGALVIFDEIITGFRLSIGGAQGYFSVSPDLSTFGKAMANGYPISVMAGKKEIIERVEDTTFISSTFGGDLVSIAASIATIKVMKQLPVNDHILRLGARLRDGLNKAMSATGLNASCEGMPHKTFTVFKDTGNVSGGLLQTIFRRECLKRGMFLGYGHFLTYSHTEQDIDAALSAATEVLEELGHAVREDNMEIFGNVTPSKEVFRRY